MKVSPINAPTQTADTTPGKDLRSRAVSKFMNQLPESAPMPQTTSSQVQEAAASAPSPEAPQTSAEGHQSTIETPVAPEATAPAEPLSAQFAQLARKEKALRAKAQAQEATLRAREEALRQREEALNKPADAAPQVPQTVSVEDLMIDPLGTLERLGLNYDKLTERAANQVNTDPTIKAYIQKLEAKINQLEEDTKGTKQSIEQQQQGQYKQAIAQIRQEAASLVKSDPQFESIKETDSVDDVVELIEKTWKEGIEGVYEAGTLLSVEEAAKMVEDELSERLISYATKINKVKSKFQAAAPVDKAPATPPKQEADTTQQPQAPMRTLTNAQSTSRPLSARERAIRAFRGDKA